MSKQKIKHGLVIVNTGSGKAKARAALIEHAVVLTALIKYADLVTQMVEVKHL